MQPTTCVVNMQHIFITAPCYASMVYATATFLSAVSPTPGSSIKTRDSKSSDAKELDNILMLLTLAKVKPSKWWEHYKNSFVSRKESDKVVSFLCTCSTS